LEDDGITDITRIGHQIFLQRTSGHSRTFRDRAAYDLGATGVDSAAIAANEKGITTMKYVIAALALALIPASAFASDGAVLINCADAMTYVSLALVPASAFAVNGANYNLNN
jgi:hypothetical protein